MSATTQFQYVPPYGQFLFRWMISVQSSVRCKHKLIKNRIGKGLRGTAWRHKRHKDDGDCIVSRTICKEQTATLHMVRWSLLERKKNKIKQILGFWLIHQNESNSKRAQFWVMLAIKLFDKQSQPLIPKWQYVFFFLKTFFPIPVQFFLPFRRKSSKYSR